MYVLGISGGLGHDAAVCLMREGKVIYVIEEERLSRKSHARNDIPLKSIEYCLNKEGITLDQVDYIAFGWDPELFTSRLLSNKFTHIENFFPKQRFNYKKLPKVEFVEHHLAHAASSYYFSGFNDATVLVIDGAGENNSTSLFSAQNNQVRKIFEISWDQSLGLFYNAVSRHIGFDWIDAGKTMGLSAFGEVKYTFEELALNQNRGYNVTLPNVGSLTDLKNVEAEWIKVFERNGITSNKSFRDWNSSTFSYVTERNFAQQHKNLAASAQAQLEAVLINLVKVSIERTGCRNLCFAGGVALNCVANGKIERSGLVDNLFIQPASGDAGTAIGAAAEISVRLGFKIDKLIGPYSGPEFTNDDIRGYLLKTGVSYKESTNFYNEVANHLAEGKSVGWFQGRAEYGPRALGNRSILSSPTKNGIQDYINLNVKYRETFRPFGPSVLLENAKEWFEDIKYSPFMLKSYQMKESKIDNVRGVTHVDGSSRPQTVTKEINQRYYELIHSFYMKTGTPMLLNTSFNVRGEPMVCSPADALRTFYSSGLDLLVINDYIISKY